MPDDLRSRDDISPLIVMGRVHDAIEDELGITLPPADRGERSTLAELGADSLDQCSLAMEIEQIFGIELADEDITGATTVGGIVALVCDRLGVPMGPEG